MSLLIDPRRTSPTARKVRENQTSRPVGVTTSRDQIVTSMDETWRADLGQWLEPFLAELSHRARWAMLPLYVARLLGPGDRKRPSASAAAVPRRAPLAARWALHVVLSSSTSPFAGKVGRMASNIRSYQLRRHQRRQR